MAGNNVSAGNAVTAGTDVLAGRDVRALRNVDANQDVNAGRNVNATEHVNAGIDVNAGRDMNAGRDVTAGRDVIAENDVWAKEHVWADGDVKTNRVDLTYGGEGRNLPQNPSTTYSPISNDTQTKLVEKFKAADGTEYYRIEDGLGNNSNGDKDSASLYVLDNGDFKRYTGSTEGAEFVHGGTAADYQRVDAITTNVVKELTDENLTYKDSTVTKPSFTANVATTDQNGNAVSHQDVSVVDSLERTEESKEFVSGTNADGNGAYGVRVSQKNAQYNANGELESGMEEDALLTSSALKLSKSVDGETSTTELTAEGLNTTTVNAKNINTDVLNAKDVNADKVTAKDVIADKVVVNGRDVEAEFNYATADRAKIRQEMIEGDAATLQAANAYTDTRASQLNRRIDDVQKTAYRGVAIALAAQQAVPNVAPGQVAVFGGVGHYEGETAGSVGVVTSFTNRLSASGAFGFAGGNEFGGRVGVAYVFGGK
ncbi:hypothetical protein F2A31_05525 [Acinetobacter suaedae]|uniref:Trimeric autotransporter adhesin YadA-like C-terminal membrane anchor domain-containing protein n=2 Tax=Acinetobacter suaedae TaxID=2609668 RepID=A0A5P1UW69_9GAMM|nr:hypothetical protein F2A31_05525 [Acinetobacter sp. C16S1]